MVLILRRLLRYYRDGFVSFYSAWNFAAILRRVKFGKVQIARTYDLLNLAAGFYLEFYCYKIFKA